MTKILMIDDEQDFHDVYAGVLRTHGYQVSSALTPDEGVALAESESPDLIVLDIMMPDGFEGFDVARRIRRELELTALPILVLSSVHDKKQLPYRFDADEYHLPIDHWLDKPVDPETLLEKVRVILNDREPVAG